MKASQKDMLAHSEAKVGLLKAYLEAYLAIIANDGFTQSIDFFDFFCGEGVYPNGKEGSPLIIAQMLDRLCKQRAGSWIPKLNFYWNDVDTKKVYQVSQLIEKQKIGDHPQVNLMPFNKDYVGILEEAQKRVQSLSKKQKAFLFIDPYGYKDIKPFHIRDLLQGGQSEVLLFQPSQHLFRFSERGTPAALEEFLQELSNGEDWPLGLTIWEYIQHTAGLFKKYLGEKYFVDTFTIEKQRPKTVFCLFFFSPHIRGFEKMLEAKWKMDADNGRGWHYNDAIAGFDLFDQPQTNQLEDYLEKKMKTQENWNNAEIYELILRKGFLPKHGRQILTQWQKRGKIEISPKPSRKGAFYLSYENFQQNPRKVQISLVS